MRRLADITLTVVVHFGIIILTFVPTWLYLGLRALLSPHGFWQELVLFGVGAWVLGAAQIVFIIVGIYMIVIFWDTSRR